MYLQTKMKIAIIKLGAKGDVIRTLPVTKAIKNKFPDSEITWITKNNVKELLTNLSYIDKIATTTGEEFDMLYNFDIDDEATFFAKKIKATKKYGFTHQDNFTSAFNLGAEYYLNTLFDDELKKTNEKTYQEMMFQVAELPPNKEIAEIDLPERDINYAETFAKENNIQTGKLVGIHLGASPRWPSKVWHESNLIEFIRKAKRKNYEILLFGGPDEIEQHKKLSDKLELEGLKVFKNNPYNTDKQFAALVKICKTMICADSFALHISLALKKPTVGLFFCTPPNEVEDYGLLKKLTASSLYDFLPAKMDQYSEELTKSISADEVLSAIDEILLPSEKKSL